MDRRNLILILAIIGVVVLGFLYAQWKFYRTPPTRQQAAPSMRIPTAESGPLQVTEGTKHSVPLDEIVSGGVAKDGIPSIDNPQFESVAQADRYLKNDGYGLGIEVNGSQRFYPYQILVWHEIVNDTFNGKPLLVTYCPLCFTGAAFERTIDGEPVEFGTSGKLWNNNLVMYDRKTESYWSQALSEAIVGPLTGRKLTHYPVLTVRWEDWKEAHPNGEVLSRDTGHRRDYTRDPYGDYYDDPSVLFPLRSVDDRLPTKARVFGVRMPDGQKAYPWDAVRRDGIINDTVGGVPVLIFHDSEQSTTRGFMREANERPLTFQRHESRLIDEETGSVWTFEGEAVSGPLRGTRLEPVVLEGGFWFSWAVMFPETQLYK